MAHNESMVLRVDTLTRSTILVAAKHNLREIPTDSADPDHSSQNRILVGPTTAKEVQALALQLASEHGDDAARTMRRKDGKMAAEAVFGLSACTDIDVNAYFGACLEYLHRRCGTDSILSAVVHLDEGHPHLHVLLLPVADGVWRGSRVWGRYERLQIDFHAAVASKFGLRRPPKRLLGADRHATAGDVIQAMRDHGDPALNSPAWPIIRDAIHEDPTKWAELYAVRITRTGRTMSELKVSAGRGAKREREEGRSPIALAHAKGHTGGQVQPCGSTCGTTVSEMRAASREPDDASPLSLARSSEAAAAPFATRRAYGPDTNDETADGRPGGDSPSGRRLGSGNTAGSPASDAERPADVLPIVPAPPPGTVVTDPTLGRYGGNDESGAPSQPASLLDSAATCQREPSRQSEAGHQRHSSGLQPARETAPLLQLLLPQRASSWAALEPPPLLAGPRCSAPRDPFLAPLSREPAPLCQL